MAQGKFSNPRPHRDEERQIEQAFRQVTGQEPVPQPTSPLLTEEEQIEQAIREMKQQTAATPIHPTASPRPTQQELLPEDVDAYFDTPTPRYLPDPYEPEPDFLDKATDFFRRAADFCVRNQKVVAVGACAGALLLILAIIGMFFAGSKAETVAETILDRVYLADIHVGGMTKEEAVSAVKEYISADYSSEDMVVDLSGTELILSPKSTKAKLDVTAAVNAAYDYGRTGTKAEQEQAASRTEPYIIGLLPYLELDTDYILEVLTEYAEDSGSTLTQPTYGLEGKEPELSVDKFDPDASTQTLVITLGTPGIGFDVKDVYDDVLDAYSLHTFRVEVENVTTTRDPDPVDLEAIYEEFYIAPVNATVNMNTFETEPGSYGYDFDLKTAQKLLDKAEFGEEIRIPMQYIEPEILDDDSFFRDTLGEHQTRVTGNSSRKKNLELACEAIDGTVLNPGETLSFSNALSNVRGFQTAAEDSGMDATERGGVSQVASTLYYAALVSDLSIDSRSSHSYIPSFIDQGLDATASLRIRNSTGFPLRIDAEVSGGYVRVEILGTEERDYYIVMDSSVANTIQPETEYQEFPYDNAEGYKDGDIIEEGQDGYLVKSYKVKYDRNTGRELSRDFVTNSQYPARNQIVALVEPEPTTEETTEPTTEATEPPTEPTVPETQPTTVPTTPPTEPVAAATEPVSATEPPATEPAQIAETAPTAEAAPIEETQPVPQSEQPSANLSGESSAD